MSCSRQVPPMTTIRSAWRHEASIGSARGTGAMVSSWSRGAGVASGSPGWGASGGKGAPYWAGSLGCVSFPEIKIIFGSSGLRVKSYCQERKIEFFGEGKDVQEAGRKSCLNENTKVHQVEKLSSFLGFCSTAFRQGKQLLTAEKAPLNGGGSNEPNQEQEQGLLAKCGKAQ